MDGVREYDTSGQGGGFRAIHVRQGGGFRAIHVRQNPRHLISVLGRGGMVWCGNTDQVNGH